MRNVDYKMEVLVTFIRRLAEEDLLKNEEVTKIIQSFYEKIVLPSANI